MYFLIKHSIDRKISQVLFYHSSCHNVRKYLQDYLDEFLKKNNNLEKEYSYNYNEDSYCCVVNEKSMIIRNGYIWNSVEYTVKEHSYYSISYFSNHYITNVTVETYKVFNHNDKIVENFNNVIKELKKNNKFLKYKI